MWRRGVAILAILLGGMAGEAQAQVRGFPLYAVPVPRGVTLGADLGFATDDFCPGTCVGGSAAMGLGRFGLSAMLANSGFGGLVTLTVLQPVRSPFAVVLQGGVSGRLSGGALQVPFGAGFSVSIPTPVVSMQAWLGARGQYMDPGDGWDGSGAVHAGLSAGLDFTLLNGLGVRAAYDRVFIANNNPSTFGVGVFFSFDPGL